MSCDSHVTIQEDRHLFCDDKEESLDQVFCFIDIFISYTPYLSRTIVVALKMLNILLLLYGVLEHSFKCYMLVLECIFRK